MMNHRQLLAGAAALLLAHTAGKAADTAVVSVKSERDVFVLKVGYATFDSMTNTRFHPAFTNLTERLKAICQESRAKKQVSWKRWIDFEVAFGSDYQVLNWLQTAQIDGATICPAALQLYNQWNPRTNQLVCFSSRGPRDCATAYQPKLRSSRVINGERQPQPDPEGDFQTFLQSLTAAPSPASSNTHLICPSHFSAAGFLAPVAYANRFLQSAAPSLESNFWARFFAQLEFSFGQLADTQNRAESALLIEFSPDVLPAETADFRWAPYTNPSYVVYPWLTNIFAVSSAVAEKVMALPSRDAWSKPSTPDPVIEALCNNPVLKQYLRPLFTIPELVRLVRADQATSYQDELALVLSGGGVKAAYQSKLIDHLYSERLLSNTYSNNNGNHSRSNLLVKSIVGNSGGALLGFFVAALQDNDPRELSTILWKPDREKPLTDRSIFGFLDLPRWANFIICIWCFIIVVRVGAWLLKAVPQAYGEVSGFLQQKGLTRPAPVMRPVTPYSVARLLGLWIFGVLAVIPLLLKAVNGPPGEEHVPAIQGLFYFICLCAVLLIDNCVASPSASAPAAPRALTVPTALMILAAVITLVPLAGYFLKQGWVTQLMTIQWLDETITRGAIMACAGILLFWMGVIWRLFARKDRCMFAVGDFAVGTLLGLLVVGIVYLLLWIFVNAGKVTFLELTLSFWGWSLGLTLFVSLICFFLGIWRTCPVWFRQTPLEAIYRFLNRGLTFHLAKHQNGGFGLTRFVRMHLIFTVAFVYWNVLMAPGIYGNSKARTYFYKAYRAFTNQGPYQLQTLYAAPANDLKADRERYFLYHPGRAELSTTVASLTNKFKTDARNRWSVYPSSEGDIHMRQVVFASGSPFPIFSPHGVEPREGEPIEWLVDGGYAHNIPLEAAREIGARQVLLLNSSPADEVRFSAQAAKTDDNTFFGQLSRNIPRLFPFLFNRSQVADLLIREQMFIVSLSPQPDPHWPPLFDFRRSIVEHLLEVARADTRKRVGRIEACGPPVFLIYVRSDRTDPRGRSA